jgi:hypothetical protein
MYVARALRHTAAFPARAGRPTRKIIIDECGRRPNAAGLGTLMLIRDHIDLLRDQPPWLERRSPGRGS